jgi:exodeoxyribonuclease V beta subunit
LGDDYRPEEHFGGVYYLFLRGMAPDDSLGVFWDRPSETMRARLSALLDEGRLP